MENIPRFFCPLCGREQFAVIQATACYVTKPDNQAQALLDSTIYQLLCPHCKHDFSVTVPANKH